MTTERHLPTEPEIAWKMEFRDSGIEFLCHTTGEVYICFNWNGTGVWEYAGHVGRKSFPNWLRKVADQMEKKP